MFCQEPEEIAMVNHLCSVYPASEEYMVDLMVWCWRHKNAEYTRLMEKYGDYKGLEEEMMTLEPIVDWSEKEPVLEWSAKDVSMINGEIIEEEIKEKDN